MPNKPVLLISLLLTGSALANPLPEEIIEQPDCTRVMAVLQGEDIRNAPVWTPDQGAPPVDVSAVVRKLRAYADAHADLSGATLQQITLKQLPRHAPGWHYLAMMHSADGKPHYFVILMDGRVYPAIREPASVR